MKNKTILLGMVLAIFATLFTSCQKQDITPTQIDEVKNINLSNKVDLITLTDLDLEPQNEFSIPIKVVLSTCPSGGYTFSISSTEANLSNGNYTVKWYKKNHRGVYFVGNNLACVCGSGVLVKVIHETGNLAAAQSLDIPGC